jgi:AAA+ ATPase superfamily predicted ATPase
MSEIIGREREKQIFNESLNSHRSELVAVYGRRRIGKTFLIREFFTKNLLFSFTGLRNGGLSDQLENFMIELKRISQHKYDKKPDSWLEAFSFLRLHLEQVRETKKKKVILIDEFPWVDSMRSGFLPAFENFWNAYCTTRKDLIVVVCGSSASYMIKKIIRNRGGLHNRITQKIKLEPFTLSEVKAFFKYKRIRLPDIEILKLYMTFGGIAEYLEHIQPGDSSITAIDRICFQKGAQLEYEFDEVFKSLFEEGSYHEQIIHTLAKGPKIGMTRDEILHVKGISSGGQFSKSLLELIESGFVEQYQSYRSKRKITRYRIFDEFCLFHLQFMHQNKGVNWIQLSAKNEYHIWSGYAFELICYKHVSNIKKELRCDQIQSVDFSWNNLNAQIDLVIDRKDDITILCELKFYNDVFYIDANYAQKLRMKESEYRRETKTKKAVYTMMLSTYGIKGSHALGSVVKSIKMDVLF